MPRVIFTNIQPGESWGCNRHAFVTGLGLFFGFLEGSVYWDFEGQAMQRKFIMIFHDRKDHKHDFRMVLEGLSALWRL